jgi:hypothetical protein
MKAKSSIKEKASSKAIQRAHQDTFESFLKALLQTRF